MQILAAYTESFCIITPGGFLYRGVLYKYMLAEGCTMRPDELKQALRHSAMTYAQTRGFNVDSSPKSAIIFKKIADAFCHASFDAIRKNADWFSRTQKSHQNLPGVMEMQSSNSSDALLMNIFCHPMLISWKGVADVLGFKPANPAFGFKALVEKKGTNGDKTEIDMVIGNYFVEAKLTESDFTDKDVVEVNKYKKFVQHFHTNCLPIHNGCYQNYQIIRNLLAAIQHEKQHMLLCDERRPDLARRYMETVCCLRDQQIRKRCRVVFWQEVQRACGKDLGLFLQSRYGLC